MSTAGNRWRRPVLVMALVAALGLTAVYLAREPLLRGIGHQLVHADPVAPSDAILVLAGGVLERELEAADLFHRGMAPIVLMTSEGEGRITRILRERNLHVDTKIDLHHRVLQQLGVPSERIEILQPPVASTRDEADRVRDWAARTGASSLLVVTSSFHTARARLIFRKALGDTGMTLRFVPASESEFDPDRWWTNRSTLREGLFEWQKTLFYRVWY